MNISIFEQDWIRSQLEPEEKLFVGRRPLHEPKPWMMKPEPRPERSEKELEQVEDEYLKKHGL